MSFWEAESMAVSNKGNNAFTLARLRRGYRCPANTRPGHVRATWPVGRKKGPKTAGLVGPNNGRLNPGELRRKADTAQPRVCVPAALIQHPPPATSTINPEFTSIGMKRRREREPGD